MHHRNKFILYLHPDDRSKMGHLLEGIKTNLQTHHHATILLTNEHEFIQRLSAGTFDVAICSRSSSATEQAIEAYGEVVFALVLSIDLGDTHGFALTDAEHRGFKAVIAPNDCHDPLPVIRPFLSTPVGTTA